MQPQPISARLEASDKPAVRFPVTENRQAIKGRLPRLSDLLPRRWRRVVIQGQHYWLPG